MDHRVDHRVEGRVEHRVEHRVEQSRGRPRHGEGKEKERACSEVPRCGLSASYSAWMDP